MLSIPFVPYKIEDGRRGDKCIIVHAPSVWSVSKATYILEKGLNLEPNIKWKIIGRALIYDWQKSPYRQQLQQPLVPQLKEQANTE